VVADGHTEACHEHETDEEEEIREEEVAVPQQYHPCDESDEGDGDDEEYDELVPRAQLRHVVNLHGVMVPEKAESLKVTEGFSLV
jgi:hypothetical protein